MVTTKTGAWALSISTALIFGASLAGASYLAPQAKKAQKKPAAGAKAKPVAATADTAKLAVLGKKIYDAQGCAVCHAIGGKGGQAGPDLSKTGADAKHTVQWFMDQVKNPKTHTAGSTMPAYEGKIKGADLTNLSIFLTTLGGPAKGEGTGGTGAPAVIKIAPPSPAVVAKIEKSGGTVRQVAMSDQRLEIDFHLTGASVTDAALTPLAGIKGVVELNLGKTSVTDAGLVHIKGLTDLTTLHLEGTKITDKGLANIKGLKNLTYLNVYNTAVTDEGLNQLAGLTNLKSLYVWQTKVTKAGADKLKAALPKVEIVLGWDADAKPEEKKQ
jgi:mono/diheme cytochrome c family protein